MPASSRRASHSLGGSSISQQLAKNLFTTGRRSWFRKGFEAAMTVLLEYIWGKRKIFETWLNVIELGDGIFGIEAACNAYFNCSAKDVNAADVINLAICIPAPLRNTPAEIAAIKHRRTAAITRNAWDMFNSEPFIIFKTDDRQ